MRIFDNVTESSTVSFDVPVFEGYDAETGDLRAIRNVGLVFQWAQRNIMGLWKVIRSPCPFLIPGTVDLD